MVEKDRAAEPPAGTASPTPSVNRRRFLALSAAPILATSMAGCDALTTGPAGNGDEATEADPKGKEAPSLAKLVRAGDLPLVEERLPKNPLVVEPVDRVGVYGGERRTPAPAEVEASLNVNLDYENLVRWHPTDSAVVPNVAESVSQNDDGTEYTFTLRQGMKWSDGAPFTAADVLFWYEDVFSNDELSPVKVDWMITDGEPGRVEAVDDDTVRFLFTAPNGLLLQNMATGWTGSAGPTSSPRHYLVKFHNAHHPDEADQLAKDQGLDDWVALFLGKADAWANADKPTLDAWTITAGIGESPTQVVAERNPYYWKVDPDGSQLPYLDSVVHEVVDTETAVLRTQNGEYDLPKDINTLDNKPLFARSREQGSYRFVDTIPGIMNDAIIFLNLTHKDSSKRVLFQNKDLRIGLSYAINRQEVIDAVFRGQGEPWQAAPRPEATDFYNEELAKQYTEHDVQKANEYLDRAGFVDRDNDGFRLGPRGERISVRVENASGLRPEWADVLELIRGYWRDVGIQLQIKTEGSSLFWERMEANEYDAVIWHGDGGLAIIGAPFYYFPYSFACKFAPAWGFWYTGDPRGEEPPAPVREQMSVYDQIKTTTDVRRQRELMNTILEIAVDQFYCIGVTLTPVGYQVVTNSLHNVPDPLPYDFYHAMTARTNNCQYFRED